MKAKGILPFSIDRSSPISFADQVVDGLTEAISSGRFCAGDRLPTWREMAETLGVSQRVPREAMSRLVREGLVVARPRIGCAVAERRHCRKPWKGTVLVVQRKCASDSYSSVRMFNAMERILVRAGFAVVRTTVDHMGGRQAPYDLAMVDRLLSFKIDFVVIEGFYRRLQRLVAARNVMFFRISGGCICADLGESAIGGHLALDFSRAIACFVEHCRRAGAGRVLQVSFVCPELFDAVPALTEAGIKGERWSVPCKYDATTNEVMRAGYRAFSERLKTGRGWLPDVLLITDDYLSIGVVMALINAGVRIPEELKIVTFANAGNEPVFPVSPACIVADYAGQGEMIAQMILEIMGGKARRHVLFHPTYVTGGTFPPC